MKLLAKLTTSLGTLFAYACVATAVAQGVGAAWLAGEGAFSRDKLRKYAAVLYGFDLVALSSAERESSKEESEQQGPRDQLLKQRAAATPDIALRLDAIRRGADDIRLLAQQLATRQERYEIVKQSFGHLLTQLEQDASTAALNEVRNTLEALRPRQSKDLIIGMLRDEELDPREDVMEDVLQIVRGMPQDKLKRIFGEFKTDREREQLHRILVAIGEI